MEQIGLIIDQEGEPLYFQTRLADKSHIPFVRLGTGFLFCIFNMGKILRIDLCRSLFVFTGNLIADITSGTYMQANIRCKFPSILRHYRELQIIVPEFCRIRCYTLDVVIAHQVIMGRKSGAGYSR